MVEFVLVVVLFGCCVFVMGGVCGFGVVFVKVLVEVGV